MVRSFVLLWVGLVFLLAYGVVGQAVNLRNRTAAAQPVKGGEYSEALVGSATSFNPILPDNSATSDVNRLLFRGLTRFNANGQLEADLATGWTVSQDGKTYTFRLRHGVKWHDGVPFTAQDVAFTLAAIQNPDSRSPLAANWLKVKVQTPDDYTVVYSLPKPFTPFISSTTVGVLPQHLLANIEPSTLRLASFNQHPVGLGPYRFDHLDVKAGVISLSAYDHFYGGKPAISAITLRTFASYGDAMTAYTRRQVMAVARVPAEAVAAATRQSDLRLHELSLPTEVGVFFQTASPILTDKAVRQGLALATDRNKIVQQSLAGHAAALASPLLPGEINGGNQHQPSLNLAAAKKTLGDGGWVPGPDGIRAKAGRRLKLRLVTQSKTTYEQVARQIQSQWKLAGAQVDIITVNETTLQQSYIRTRHYDMLLYGMNVGPDPDVYAFWDSSQAADPGLNVSVYKSNAADKALEAGRIVHDPATRSAKYKAFVSAWISDTPAVMLYSPTYIYAQNQTVQGAKVRKLIDPADRFYDITAWSVKHRTVFGG